MQELTGFQRYLESEKRFSLNTIQAYFSDLNQFVDFTRDQYDLQGLKDVSTAMVRSWIINLMDQNITPRSINRKLSTLKSFYKYLMREGLIKANPMSKVIAPRNGKRLPIYMEQSDMEVLLTDEMFESGFPGIRDRLVIMLFYYTGIRRGELLGMKVSSYDRHGRNLKVLGKGNKERIVPLNDEMMLAMNAYISEREQLFGKDEKTLILTDKGKKAYPKFIYRLVTSYLSKVSTIQKKSPHVLRHTFATHMLNNGADLNSIKEILGHANLSATQVYTHNSIEKLKQIYEQAHPKA